MVDAYQGWRIVVRAGYRGGGGGGGGGRGVGVRFGVDSGEGLEQWLGPNVCLRVSVPTKLPGCAWFPLREYTYVHTIYACVRACVRT